MIRDKQIYIKLKSNTQSLLGGYNYFISFNLIQLDLIFILFTFLLFLLFELIELFYLLFYLFYYLKNYNLNKNFRLI